jgi:hypothetical protein
MAILVTRHQADHLGGAGDLRAHQRKNNFK